MKPVTDEELSEDFPELFDQRVLLARIESDRAVIASLKAQLEANRAEVEELRSAYVLQAAIMESVMRAIRGESVSDFESSHGPVYEAMTLRLANMSHARITGELRAEVERLNGICDRIAAAGMSDR